MSLIEEDAVPSGAFLRMCESHDDHGYKVIALRMSAVKKASRSLLNCIHKRIKAEEEMAIRYASMAAELKYESDSSNVNTTEQSSIEAYRNELRELHSTHYESSKRMTDEVAIKMNEFREKHKKVIKDVFTQYEKFNKQKSNIRSQFSRIEAQYVRCCNDLAVLREGAASKVGKEAEKHNQRQLSAETNAKQAEVKFGQIKVSLDNTISDFDANWQSSLENIEKIERLRLELMKTLLKTMNTIFKESLERSLMINERMMLAVERINPAEDLENFVRITADVPSGSQHQNVIEAFNVTRKMQNLDISNIPGSLTPRTGANSGSIKDGSQLENSVGYSELSSNEAVSSSRPQSEDIPAAGENSDIDYLDLNVSYPSLGNVIALYRYSSEINEELKFEAGQTMQILDKQPSGWWVAEYQYPSGNGVKHRGLIPSNFVKMIP